MAEEQKLRHLITLYRYDISILTNSTFIESEDTQRERVSLGRSIPQLREKLKGLEEKLNG